MRDGNGMIDIRHRFPRQRCGYLGIIICAAKGESLARYATEGLENKMLVSKYLTALPDEKLLAAEIDKTRRELEKSWRRAGEEGERMRMYDHKMSEVVTG